MNTLRRTGKVNVHRGILFWVVGYYCVVFKILVYIGFCVDVWRFYKYNRNHRV